MPVGGVAVAVSRGERDRLAAGRGRVGGHGSGPGARRLLRGPDLVRGLLLPLVRRLLLERGLLVRRLLLVNGLLLIPGPLVAGLLGKRLPSRTGLGLADPVGGVRAGRVGGLRGVERPVLTGGCLGRHGRRERANRLRELTGLGAPYPAA